MKVVLTKDSTGDFKFATDSFTFKLEDVLRPQGAETLKLPFEDYKIVLVKVEMRPIGTNLMMTKGFGHTVPITDARLQTFTKKTGLLEDPLANFDGSRKWSLRHGFKRLLRPKPQLVITDLSTANEVAPIWLNSSRSFWIPLQQAGKQIEPEKVNHYGLAYSYLQPSPSDLNYEAEITFYMKFRQFAWTALKDPGTPNLDLPPNMELMNIIDEHTPDSEMLKYFE